MKTREGAGNRLCSELPHRPLPIGKTDGDTAQTAILPIWLGVDEGGEVERVFVAALADILDRFQAAGKGGRR